MIEPNLQSDHFGRGSSAFARLVRVPIISFFLFSITSMLVMQLNTARHIIQNKLNTDFPQHPEMTKSSNMYSTNASLQSQPRALQVVEQTFLNEYSDSISQYHSIESKKNTLQENRTLNHDDSPTLRSNNGSGYIQQQPQMRDTDRKGHLSVHQKAQQAFLNEHNSTITQSHSIESRENILEGNITVNHENSSNGVLNEHNGTITQSHSIESRENILEGNVTVDRGNSSTVEINKREANIQQLPQARNTSEKDPLNSRDVAKVITQMDNIVIPIRNHRNKKAVAKPKKRKTRVIFGIMTYDSTSERRRRGLIRGTFLSYFKNHMNRTIVTDEEYEEKKHWICSLNDLDHERLEFPEKCRMAYAFVRGANPNGTSMLLNFNETYPLALRPPKAKTRNQLKDASDSIFLNIQENGKFGKSPTWFRYAIDVLERHGWMKDWDYVFKSDTDNLLYTPRFFRFVDRLPRKRAVRVYGGLPLNYNTCGGDKHDHCKQMIGPYFMQGGCYFLSLDLAKFISDEKSFDHQAVKLPHEDMTTGNFVYSHPKKIRIIKESRKHDVIRKHPLKKDSQFQFRWGKMLREEEILQANSTTG